MCLIRQTPRSSFVLNRSGSRGKVNEQQLTCVRHSWVTVFWAAACRLHCRLQNNIKQRNVTDVTATFRERDMPDMQFGRFWSCHSPRSATHVAGKRHLCGLRLQLTHLAPGTEEQRQIEGFCENAQPKPPTTWTSDAEPCCSPCIYMQPLCLGRIFVQGRFGAVPRSQLSQLVVHLPRASTVGRVLSRCSRCSRRCETPEAWASSVGRWKRWLRPSISLGAEGSPKVRAQSEKCRRKSWLLGTTKQPHLVWR